MISTKERAILRGFSNNLKDDVIIGKDGITDNVIKQIEECLFAHEIVKIKVLKNADLTSRESCDIICEKTNAEPVSCVGNKIVIYKKTTKKQFNHYL